MLLQEKVETHVGLKLRPYQQTAVDKIVAGLQEMLARLLFQMPTGSGKTEVAIGTIGKILSERPDARFIFLAHRDVLVKQTAERLRAAGVTARAAIGNQWPRNAPVPMETVIVTTPTILRNRLALEGLTGTWYLIVDEAHHAPAATWAEIISAFPGPVVGLTATPWRLAKKEGFDHIFTDLICGPQVSELVEAGYLSDPLVVAAKADDKIHGGPTNRGDYTQSGIMERNDNMILTERAIEWWLACTGGETQTIFYAVTKGHARRLTELLQNCGVGARAILDDTPEHERDEIVADFRAKRHRALVSVTVMTEGADFPEADCIVMLRPTKSLALFLQMVGRAMRRNGDARALILDATNNTETHGLPTQNREWSLAPRGEDAQGEPPAKECPECRTMAMTRTEECPECGYAYGETCPQCGRWRPWNRWMRGPGICDECFREARFDYTADTGVRIDDGWAVSQKGNLYLSQGIKRGTLYWVRGRRPHYVAYITIGDRDDRIELKTTSEEQAKRQTEEHLGLSAPILRRRIRSCKSIVDAARHMTDEGQRETLLNGASVHALGMRIEVEHIMPAKTRAALRKEFDDLLKAGQKARQEMALL